MPHCKPGPVPSCSPAFVGLQPSLGQLLTAQTPPSAPAPASSADRMLTNVDDPIDIDLERPFLGADRAGGVPERSRMRSSGVGGREHSRPDGRGGVLERQSGEHE